MQELRDQKKTLQDRIKSIARERKELSKTDQELRAESMHVKSAIFDIDDQIREALASEEVTVTVIQPRMVGTHVYRIPDSGETMTITYKELTNGKYRKDNMSVITTNNCDDIDVVYRIDCSSMVVMYHTRTGNYISTSGYDDTFDSWYCLVNDIDHSLYDTDVDWSTGVQTVVIQDPPSEACSVNLYTMLDGTTRTIDLDYRVSIMELRRQIGETRPFQLYLMKGERFYDVSYTDIIDPTKTYAIDFVLTD